MKQLFISGLLVAALMFAGCGAQTSAEESSQTREVYAMDTVMTLEAYGQNADAALDEAVRDRAAGCTLVDRFKRRRDRAAECGKKDHSLCGHAGAFDARKGNLRGNRRTFFNDDRAADGSLGIYERRLSRAG